MDQIETQKIESRLAIMLEYSGWYFTVAFTHYALSVLTKKIKPNTLVGANLETFQ